MYRSDCRSRLLSVVLSCLLMWGVCPASAGGNAGIAVIVNPSNTMEPLDKDEVAYLFLRKAKAFPHGLMAKPVLMPEGSPARIRFERSVFGKEPLQIRAYWARLVFTGRGKPPKSMPSVVDVKRYVASEPAAISYIPDTEVDATVKVLYRLR